jgi:hypothetical protein
MIPDNLEWHIDNLSRLFKIRDAMEVLLDNEFEGVDDKDLAQINNAIEDSLTSIHSEGEGKWTTTGEPVE